MNLTKQDIKLIDKYWNEHDGNFYKDELKELIAEIKSNAIKEIIKKGDMVYKIKE